MPVGAIVSINGKAWGMILKWNKERQQYLVEVCATGTAQYVAEKYLIK
jgi:hypothetical protein